jgi:hypothetical protein
LNYNNKKIVPTIKGKLEKNDFGKAEDRNQTRVHKSIRMGIKAKYLPLVVNIPVGTKGSHMDHIVYTWDTYLSFAKRQEANKSQSRDHINKYLMQKVYTINDKGERVALIHENVSKKTGKVYYNFVYKAINPWGDSFRAQEFYDYITPSALDNDFKKVRSSINFNAERASAGEIDDSVIAGIIEGNMSIEDFVTAQQAIDKKNAAAAKVNKSQPNSLEPAAINGPKYYTGPIVPDEHTVFVFGSNPQGIHGAGAALNAKNKFGAKQWIGRGLVGNSYALVTKSLKAGFVEPRTRIKYEYEGERSVSPEQIVENIQEMYMTAASNPNKIFKVTYDNAPDEVTLNGYSGAEMIEMFLEAGEVPPNVLFSKTWVDTGLFVQKEKTTGTPGVTRTAPTTVAGTKAAPVTAPTDVKQATKDEKIEITKRMAEVINESAKHHLPKERFKTVRATQYIGYGAPNSSTDNYRKLYAEYGLANTGKYNSDDLVYVSSNGKRTGRIAPTSNNNTRLTAGYDVIDTAIAAGANFIMDTAYHLKRYGGYNLGEVALAEYLTSKGYTRDDKSGIWTPNRTEKMTLNINQPDGRKGIEPSGEEC